MRKFVVLLAVVAFVAALWAGGWFFAAGQIREAVAGLAPGGQQGGDGIACAKLDITGFPFRFDLNCTDATIVSGDVTATLPGVRASVLVYNPVHARLSALGPVGISDAFSGVRNSIDFSAMDGSLRLTSGDLWRGLSGEGWRIGRVSIVGEGVNWTDVTVAEATIMTAEHAEAHLVDIREQHDPASGTSALRAFATLTDTAAPGLGIAGGEATLEAVLSGLPDDLRAYGQGDAVNRWREAGGQLQLVSLSGRAGEEFIESSGALGLDSTSRLDGQIAIRSRGVVERLGDALPADWKALILGGQAEDGSYSQTLTIKAGVVFSGLIPVAVVPPLS